MFMLSITRYYISVILFTFITPGLFSQTGVDNYLSAPFIDAEVNYLQKQLDFMDEENFNLPLFRELEIRLRSNDFNATPEDYRLRLGFFNPYEQIRNKKYSEEHSKYIKVKYDFETNLLISERYKTLAKHQYLTKQLSLLRAEKETFENIQTIILKNNHSYVNWVKADESLIKKEIKIREVLLSIQLLEQSMKMIIGDSVKIHWDNITLKTIDEISNIEGPDTPESKPQYHVLKQALALKESEYMLKKSEAWSNIGFIQAEYDSERGNDLNQHLGFQLGLKIPVFNTDKPSIQRDKMDLMGYKEKLDQVSYDYQRDKLNNKNKLISNIEAYRIITNRLNKIDSLENKISHNNIENYLELTEYKGYLKMIQNEYYYSCLLGYIDIITLSGSFIVPPYVNYLLSEQ